MLRTTPWRKWAGYAAAAAILGFAIMFFWQRAEVRPKSPLVQTQAPADIAPGGTGAVLTLADGSKVELDSLGNGVVASQGGTRAVLQNGRLRYEGDEPSGPISYNTISTPRGRQFQLRLPDGTQVWLNAASSLTFPTSFSDTVRNVSITGEAYFEVAHNTEAPFLVNIRPGHTVKVLGTKFNINAYPDEPAISTTLLEGAVEAAAGAEKTILRPGFQATMDNNGLSVTAADIASAVAWKNGLFIFQKTDIRTVMRQICRWYDVEVTFEGKTAEKRLTGEVYRNYTLQQALAVLQEADLHFRVDGRRVTVLQ
jgi:ferric-dicitrate binding protein FerR (iron transport regulator)